MADTKLSALTAVSSLNRADELYIVQSGVSMRVTWGQIADITNYGPGILNGVPLVWQDGTSFASMANGTYIADNWRYNKSGAMVHDGSRSTTVPSVANAGVLIPYSVMVDCTTVDAAIAAGDYCFVESFIEGYDWLFYAQRQITIGFWVDATKTGTYCVSLTNSGADRSYVAEYTVNAADTPEFKTVTFSASPSAGTWDYTNGFGVSLRFALAAGSTYQTTANAWQTGNYLATANQVNACDSTANNFRITGLRIFPGAIMPEQFWSGEMFDYHKALSKALRYYETVGPVSGAGLLFRGLNYSGTSQGIIQWIPYAVHKRTVPTVTAKCDVNDGAEQDYTVGDNRIEGVALSLNIPTASWLDLHYVIANARF